jgi:hypothetical protein
MRMRLMVRAGQFRTQGTELLIVHPSVPGEAVDLGKLERLGRYEVLALGVVRGFARISHSLR